jgi:hypothetical protein
MNEVNVGLQRYFVREWTVLLLGSRFVGSGVNLVGSRAFGITETSKGSSDARSTVFSFLQQINSEIL